MDKSFRDNKNPVNVMIGRNLRYFMERKNISEKELSKDFGIERDSLRRILNGTNGISSEYCHILVAKYDCNMNFIFGGVEKSDIELEEEVACAQMEASNSRSSVAKLMRYLADIVEIMK